MWKIHHDTFISGGEIRLDRIQLRVVDLITVILIAPCGPSVVVNN